MCVKRHLTSRAHIEGWNPESTKDPKKGEPTVEGLPPLTVERLVEIGVNWTDFCQL